MHQSTDLVFSWTGADVPFKAWIALGVPEPTDEVRADIRAAALGLSFIGARGSRSAERLRGSGASAVYQSPDLGWLFPRLIQDHPLVHPVAGAGYLAIQAFGFPDVEYAVAALWRISKTTGLAIVLLPLCRCWGTLPR